MADILDPSALKRSVGRQRVEYPWGEWADGQTRRVAQGKDFGCSTKSFRSVLSKYGTQNNLRAVISTHDEADAEAVIFRFEPRPEGWVPKTRARKVAVEAPAALTGVVEAHVVEAEPVAEDAPEAGDEAPAADSMDW